MIGQQNTSPQELQKCLSIGTPLVFGLTLLLPALVAGCATPLENAGVAAGVTVAGGRSPGQEIEQVYYLGVFDPQDQVPPSVYRVTVHGQASVLGLTKFASGWVPAQVADSLNSEIGYNNDGKLQISQATTNKASGGFQTGRRLMLFGPEGFREAPRDHRLVIVMGTNPSKYFQTVSAVFSQMSASGQQQRNDAAVTKLLLALTQAQNERYRLEALQRDLGFPRK
jgi:hypothetical protein